MQWERMNNLHQKNVCSKKHLFSMPIHLSFPEGLKVDQLIIDTNTIISLIKI